MKKFNVRDCPSEKWVPGSTMYAGVSFLDEGGAINPKVQGLIGAAALNGKLDDILELKVHAATRRLRLRQLTQDQRDRMLIGDLKNSPADYTYVIWYNTETQNIDHLLKFTDPNLEVETVIGLKNHANNPLLSDPSIVISDMPSSSGAIQQEVGVLPTAVYEAAEQLKQAMQNQPPATTDQFIVDLTEFCNILIFVIVIYTLLLVCQKVTFMEVLKYGYSIHLVQRLMFFKLLFLMNCNWDMNMTYYQYTMFHDMIYNKFGMSSGNWAYGLNNDLFVDTEGKLSAYNKVDLFLLTSCSFILFLYVLIHQITQIFYLIGLVKRIYRGNNRVVPKNGEVTMEKRMKDWKVEKRLAILRLSLFLIFYQEWFIVGLNGSFSQNYYYNDKPRGAWWCTWFNYIVLFGCTYDLYTIVYYNIMIMYPYVRPELVLKKEGDGNEHQKIDNLDITFNIDQQQGGRLQDQDASFNHTTNKKRGYRSSKRKNTYPRETMNYGIYANDHLVNHAIVDYIQISINYGKNGFEDILSRYTNLGYLLKNCLIITILVGLQNSTYIQMTLLTMIQMAHLGVLIYRLVKKNFYDDQWLTFAIGFLINIILWMFNIYAMFLCWGAYENSADFEYTLVVFITFTMIFDVFYTFVKEMFNIYELPKKNNKVVSKQSSDISVDNVEREIERKNPEKLEKPMAKGMKIKENNPSQGGYTLQESQRINDDSDKILEMTEEKNSSNDNLGKQIVEDRTPQPRKSDKTPQPDISDKQNEANGNARDSKRIVEYIPQNEEGNNLKTSDLVNSNVLKNPANNVELENSDIDKSKGDTTKDKDGVTIKVVESKIGFGDNNKVDPNVKKSNNMDLDQSNEPLMENKSNVTNQSFVKDVNDINIMQAPGGKTKKVVVARDSKGFRQNSSVLRSTVIANNEKEQKQSQVESQVQSQVLENKKVNDNASDENVMVEKFENPEENGNFKSDVHVETLVEPPTEWNFEGSKEKDALNNKSVIKEESKWDFGG